MLSQTFSLFWLIYTKKIIEATTEQIYSNSNLFKVKETCHAGFLYSRYSYLHVHQQLF